MVTWVITTVTHYFCKVYGSREKIMGLQRSLKYAYPLLEEFSSVCVARCGYPETTAKKSFYCG